MQSREKRPHTYTSIHPYIITMRIIDRTSERTMKKRPLVHSSPSMSRDPLFLSVLVVLLVVVHVLLVVEQCAAFQVARRRNCRSSRGRSAGGGVVDRRPRHEFTLLRASSERLIPEENPYFDETATSLAGVPYKSVRTGLDRIFPPTDLDKRNALSRTDGYWPYISKGKEPPQQYTYGEFDFFFFAQLLDRVRKYHYEPSSSPEATPQKEHPTNDADWSDKVFCDIGSGTGRLVLAAAALHPTMSKCRGVELLQTIHQTAIENLNNACPRDDEATGRHCMTVVDGQESLAMAPVEYVCGSFEDPYVYFGDADVIFVFSSCMEGTLLDGLAKSIGRQCKPGTIVISTDYMLPLEGEIEPYDGDDRLPFGSFQLDLLEKVDGWCWLTGGASTAFVHQVKQSLWTPDNQGPLSPPQLSVEDQAYQVAKAMESGELTNSESFLRGVYNNMAFHDVPESFRPNIDGS